MSMVSSTDCDVIWRYRSVPDCPSVNRHATLRPAAGFVDTEIGCFKKPELAYAAKTVWA
jgi:hypothetical protein